MRPAPNAFLKPFRLGLILSLVFSCFPALSPAQETITIGLVPEMNVFAQVQRFQPLADHLSDATGIQIKLSILNHYSDIFDEFRHNNINAAFLGSFTAALVISKLNATPIARPVNLDTTSTYHGILFARKDSEITGVETMRGKTMAFVDRSTTAGYIFPLAWLKKNGVPDYRQHFSEYFFSGSHDAAIDAVMHKKADVGAAKNTIFEYYLTNHPEAKKELFVIARSTPVPSNGLCVTSSVSDTSIAKLQAALISLDKTTQGRQVLRKLRALKFVKTKSADYAPVFDLLGEAGISLESYLKREATL